MNRYMQRDDYYYTDLDQIWGNCTEARRVFGKQDKCGVELNRDQGLFILGAVDILDEIILCCPAQSGIWSVASVLGDCDHNPFLSRLYQLKKNACRHSQLSPEGQDGPWLRFAEWLVESERKTVSRAQAQS